MAQEPEQEQKGSRKILAAVLISAAVLGGGGYGIYQAVAGPAQQTEKTAKPATKKKQDTVKSVIKEAAGSDSQSNKDDSAKTVIQDAFPTLSANDEGTGVAGVLLDNGVQKLADNLNSDQTKGLVALAADATKPTPEPIEPTTPEGLPGGDNGTSGNQPGTLPGDGGQTGGGTDGGGSDSGVTTPDQAPSISAPATMTVHKGQETVNFRLGVTASDPEDGDLTNAIGYTTTLDKNTPGTYTVTYSVTDSAGHTVSVTREITVINDKPSIVFLNDNPVEVGTSFDALKDVHAADFQDGDVTSKVTAEGKVDTTTPGQYELTYSVTDSDGQMVTKQRTVTVYAEKPAIDTTDQNTSVAINANFDDLQGVKATSKYGEADLQVDGSVDTSKPGENTLTYTATDKFGQTTTKTATINVTADKPSLDVAKVPTTLKVGDQFDALANVTAASPYGEAKVTVDGSVDTGVAGDYKLTYTATDKFGQTTTKEVTVIVAADDSTDAVEED